MAVLLSTIFDFFKEEPNLVDRGRNSTISNHMESCDIRVSGVTQTVNAVVQASMKKKSYHVQITLEHKKVVRATCECPRGKLRCHHMAAALLCALEKFSKTDVPCTWNKPSKAAASSTTTTDSLWPQAEGRSGFSLNREPAEDDYAWLRDQFMELDSSLGVVWLLSAEPLPDINPHAMESLLAGFDANSSQEEFLNSLKMTWAEIVSLAAATSGQKSNPLWALHRLQRLTCSNFGKVLSAVRRNKYCPSLYKTLLGGYSHECAGAAINWGNFHEETAITMYAAGKQLDVTPTGIWLSEDGMLGGSPDGLVGDDGLVEAKCPYSHRDSSIDEAIASDKKFYLEKSASGYTLKKNHPYYDQIQGQIFVTKRAWCDMVVWTTKETVITERILACDEWRETNIPKLKEFFTSHLLPKILPSI